MSETNADSRIATTAWTAREQAALALRIPDSGTAWLDAMISRAVHLDFLKLQYTGLCSDPAPDDHRILEPLQFINEALQNEPESAE